MAIQVITDHPQPIEIGTSTDDGRISEVDPVR